jgi:hypothetical protein
MNNWRKEKKGKVNRKKDNHPYSFVDFLLDVLFSIPELILFPLRMMWWLVRGLGRMISNLFDHVFNIV